MKLINTDGMAFIGPGSEWFWTALTGLVLAVTFLGIYRQLSIARSANAREQMSSFDREWGSERMARHRLAVLVAMRDGSDQTHLGNGSPEAIANFWETMGNLTRRGYLDSKLMWDSGPGAQADPWWGWLAPHIRRQRAEGGGPTLYENFEWYASTVTVLNRRSGASPRDEAWLAAHLEGEITFEQRVLRVEQALRTVIVASPEAEPSARPPAPAVPQAVPTVQASTPAMPEG